MNPKFDWVEKENTTGAKVDLWSMMIGVAIGAAFVYLILKDRSVQTVGKTESVNDVNMSGQVVTSQYKNDETWNLNRGQDGRIMNLVVSRDARVGNGIGNNVNDINNSTTTYVPLGNTNNQAYDSNKINVDLLTERIQQKLDKRYTELNKKICDLDRQRRFGFT